MRSATGSLLIALVAAALTPGLRWVHENIAVPPGPPEQTLSLVLDIDKDGSNDIVIGGRRAGPALVWFRREQRAWTRYLVDDTATPVEAGGAFFDIDGDGDLDIVAGEDYQGPHVYWWENPYPFYSPGRAWNRHLIKDSGAHQHHDQIFGDFRGTGKPDLVFWNQGAKKLFLAPLPRDPSIGPWPYGEIFAGPGEGLASGNLDGDGLPDLVGGGRWFKYDGKGFQPFVIDSTQVASRAAVADLNRDGRPDVVMAPGESAGTLRWYENTGTPRVSWRAHDLAGVVHGHSLAVADFDRDGNPDVLCAEMRQWTKGKDDHPGARMWIFFGDGKGNFTSSEVASGFGVHEARAADLNGDGRIDILTKPYRWETPRLDLWLNLR